MTYRELLEELKKCTEEQLDKSVMISDGHEFYACEHLSIYEAEDGSALSNKHPYIYFDKYMPYEDMLKVLNDAHVHAKVATDPEILALLKEWHSTPTSHLVSLMTLEERLNERARALGLHIPFGYNFVDHFQWVYTPT